MITSEDKPDAKQWSYYASHASRGLAEGFVRLQQYDGK
jgi:hypothetical protein